MGPTRVALGNTTDGSSSGTGPAPSCGFGGCFPWFANEMQICWQAKRNIIASGCLLTNFTFSSTSGFRQYLEAITANSRVKPTCSSSLPGSLARSDATELLLQMFPVLGTRNPFSTAASDSQLSMPRPCPAMRHCRALQRQLLQHSRGTAPARAVRPALTLLKQGSRSYLFRLIGQFHGIIKYSSWKESTRIIESNYGSPKDQKKKIKIRSCV